MSCLRAGIVSKDLSAKLSRERKKSFRISQECPFTLADDHLEEALQPGRRDHGQHARGFIIEAAGRMRHAPGNEKESTGLRDRLRPSTHTAKQPDST